MSNSNPDGDLFVGLGNLPVDIVFIIIDYMPKCILPKLLYFLPIRRTVVSAILSNIILVEEAPKNC